MIKFLVKTALALVVLFVLVVVPYNYFYGTPEEKQRSSEIIGQAKGLASSVFQLLNHEKEQYQNGKYDEAMTDLKQALSMIHQQADQFVSQRPEFVDSVSELENREFQLESALKQLQDSGQVGAARDESLRVIGDLLSGLNNDTQALANQLNQYETQATQQILPR